MVNSTEGGGSEDLMDTLGSLLYLVAPSKHSFKSVEDCPDHLDRALPLMVLFVLVEAVINTALRGKKYNMADSITNINIGLLMVLAGLGSRLAMISTYTWIHQHYRLIDVPWDSAVVWLLAAVCIDCGYYWFHRASHEISFLWAVHQVHHSSEEFNLTTAWRQPILEGLGWVTHWFYLPCAFFLPTPQMLVHSELNFLYQFWIHTELVGNLGPLELIFNTASQHRVHHGANRYCIDKNYGGVLSIWDRLFGTFAQEKQNETLVYGLVDQPTFFNIFKLNSFYFKLLHLKAISTGSIKAWVYGPGWFPGLPRLGDTAALPEAPIREKHYSTASPATLVVLLVQTLSTLLILDNVSSNYSSLGWPGLLELLLLAVLSSYSTGLRLDADTRTFTVELARFVYIIWLLSGESTLTDKQQQVIVAGSVISLASCFFTKT